MKIVRTVYFLAIIASAAYAMKVLPGDSISGHHFRMLPQVVPSDPNLVAYLQHDYYNVEVFKDELYSWRDISRIGKISSCSFVDDNPEQQINLNGWLFPFYGHLYDHIWINPNGFIETFPLICDDFCNWQVPDGQNEYTRFAAPLMTDWNPSAFNQSRIHYLDETVTDNGVTTSSLTVQWTNVTLYNTTKFSIDKLIANPTCIQQPNCSACAALELKNKYNSNALQCGWCAGASICTTGIGYETLTLPDECLMPNHTGLATTAQACANLPLPSSSFQVDKVALAASVSTIVIVIAICVVGYFIKRAIDKRRHAYTAGTGDALPAPQTLQSTAPAFTDREDSRSVAPVEMSVVRPSVSQSAQPAQPQAQQPQPDQPLPLSSAQPEPFTAQASTTATADTQTTPASGAVMGETHFV